MDPQRFHNFATLNFGTASRVQNGEDSGTETDSEESITMDNNSNDRIPKETAGLVSALAHCGGADGCF